MSATNRVIIGAAGATVVGLAGVAGAISYSHMAELARLHGEVGWRAHAFPVSVDGIEIVASLVLLAHRRADTRAGWLPWAALVAGTAASVAANVAVGGSDPVGRLVAGWPAVALLVSIKLMSGLLDAAPSGTAMNGTPPDGTAGPGSPGPGQSAPGAGTGLAGPDPAEAGEPGRRSTRRDRRERAVRGPIPNRDRSGGFGGCRTAGPGPVDRRGIAGEPKELGGGAASWWSPGPQRSARSSSPRRRRRAAYTDCTCRRGVGVDASGRYRRCVTVSGVRPRRGRSCRRRRPPSWISPVAQCLSPVGRQ